MNDGTGLGPLKQATAVKGVVVENVGVAVPKMALSWDGVVVCPSPRATTEAGLPHSAVEWPDFTNSRDESRKPDAG
jgi:hypothetical protein